MAVIDLSMQGTQTALAELVGVTQPTISNLMTEGKIPSDGTLGELLLAYCARLRDQAAGRLAVTPVARMRTLSKWPCTCCRRDGPMLRWWLLSWCARGAGVRDCCAEGALLGAFLRRRKQEASIHAGFKHFCE